VEEPISLGSAAIFGEPCGARTVYHQLGSPGNGLAKMQVFPFSFLQEFPVKPLPVHGSDAILLR
jgi:hypothetical protein